MSLETDLSLKCLSSTLCSFCIVRALDNIQSIPAWLFLRQDVGSLKVDGSKCVYMNSSPTNIIGVDGFIIILEDYNGGLVIFHSNWYFFSGRNAKALVESVQTGSGFEW